MRKLSAILALLALTLSLALPSVAAQHEYDVKANSGIRHEVCTTLEGTGAAEYYTGEYTFDLLSQQRGDTLLQSLRTLVTQTHTHKTKYTDCRDLAVKTDCENGDGTTINLLYSSFVTDFQGYINNTPGGWNREHVWPKSLADFGNSGGAEDLHHIRPTDSSLNNSRDNLKYGEVEGGTELYGTAVTEKAHGGKLGGGYMEPLDNAKGDVARICLYVYARYGGELSKCSDITNVFQSVDVLLDWCALDPVDTWEMGRNEVVYAIQGNRNVFIDYPELAWLIFDREIPEDLVTPSTSVCEHTNVQVRDRVEPTCRKSGSTGASYCVDCGLKVAEAQTIPATGKHTMGQWQLEENGRLEIRVCTVCGGNQESRAVDIPPAENPDRTWIVIVAVCMGVASGFTVWIIRNKKR